LSHQLLVNYLTAETICANGEKMSESPTSSLNLQASA